MAELADLRVLRDERIGKSQFQEANNQFRSEPQLSYTDSEEKPSYRFSQSFRVCCFVGWWPLKNVAASILANCRHMLSSIFEECEDDDS